MAMTLLNFHASSSQGGHLSSLKDFKWACQCQVWESSSLPCVVMVWWPCVCPAMSGGMAFLSFIVTLHSKVSAAPGVAPIRVIINAVY